MKVSSLKFLMVFFISQNLFAAEDTVSEYEYTYCFTEDNSKFLLFNFLSNNIFDFQINKIGVVKGKDGQAVDQGTDEGVPKTFTATIEQQNVQGSFSEDFQTPLALRETYGEGYFNKSLSLKVLESNQEQTYFCFSEWLPVNQ